MKRHVVFRRGILVLMTALLLATLTACGQSLEELASGALDALDAIATEASAVQSTLPQDPEPVVPDAAKPGDAVKAPDEHASYTAPGDVAAYLHAYGKLPANFLTKAEARELGWDSSTGNLWQVADGMSIGGDVFGNREGLLPEADGRTWYECDVNYAGGFRGAERIVFSNDGLIYYTNDHYESFTQLY